MKAQLTNKHPFYKLGPDWRLKIWQVKHTQKGTAILVDNKGASLFADVGWWKELRH